MTPFYVQFLANGSDIAFSTILRVYTNASIFTVPIHCFDGKLKVTNHFILRISGMFFSSENLITYMYVYRLAIIGLRGVHCRSLKECQSFLGLV